MAVRNGKWISLKSNNRNVGSLIQSWQRTKSVNFKTYQNAMNLKANTSNNTVYADKFGNIAYWHGNYIPIRDLKFNWAAAVDGSTSKTEWQGLHAVSEAVHLYNPENGWIQNCNSTPFSVAGKKSPKKENYPSYMAPDGENFRAINAVRLLEQSEKLTLDQVIKIGYDSKLSFFELVLPKLIECFETNYKPDTKVYNELIEPIIVLKSWDYYATSNSIATTLANEWAFKINPIVQKTYINQGEKDQIENTNDFIKNAKANDLIPQLQLVISELKSKFGTWKIPWGDLNRFQRNSDAIDLVFDDTKASLSNGNASVLWGCLPAFKSNYQNNTKKRYGFNGNSFVCAVEFGNKIKAKSLLAGGNSGNFASKHFLDQAENYQNGIFKEVYFYKEDVTKNAERTYHPGE
jgi:acyl-homoserine lactone acylase PvdQ